MSTIGFLHFTAAVSRSFLHFRGTNHIGSRLSIRKAGVYFKEQDKKKKKRGNLKKKKKKKKKRVKQKSKTKFGQFSKVRVNYWVNTVLAVW